MIIHSEASIQIIKEVLNKKKSHELCRKSKFIQRSTSKIQGYEFIYTMIIPSEGLPTDTLKGFVSE